MSRWRRAIVIVVGLMLAGGAGVVLWRTRQAALDLVTNPMATRRLPTRSPINEGLLFDDVSVTSADGLRLAGWYVPTKNGAVVIALHGYKAVRGEMLNEARMLNDRGFGVLMPAMRAHDMSDGDLITFGGHELDDLGRWFDLVRRQPGVDSERIGLLGNSLGGTLALQFAARTPSVAGVVAHSPFSSLRDTIDTSVRFFTGFSPFPFAPLITFWAEREAGISIDDVDARRSIGQISPRPVLLMQGGADVVINTTSGQRLFEAAGNPKELWFDESVAHARFDTARAEEYTRRVGGFFDRLLSR